jgi:hypothetical protein
VFTHIIMAPNFCEKWNCSNQAHFFIIIFKARFEKKYQEYYVKCFTHIIIVAPPIFVKNENFSNQAHFCLLF